MTILIKWQPLERENLACQLSFQKKNKEKNSSDFFSYLGGVTDDGSMSTSQTDLSELSAVMRLEGSSSSIWSKRSSAGGGMSE